MFAHVENMSSMSTPIDKLPTQLSQAPSRTIDDDPVVRDVIDEMEREVVMQQQQHQHQQARPVDVKTTHVATLNNAAMMQQQPMQQQYLPQPPPPQNYKQPDQATNSSWINTEEAKFACIFALVALAVFYPFDTSGIYFKFNFLERFQPYELFIRALLLAAVIYVILLKVK